MTIHGLWPSGMTYDDKSPSYCTNEKFSTSKLTSTTLKRMDCAWISSTGSNEGFWSYEWSKHGTCADFPTQEAYFQAALDANGKYDLNVAFQEAGISFSNDRAPTVSELQAAMVFVRRGRAGDQMRLVESLRDLHVFELGDTGGV